MKNLITLCLIVVSLLSCKREIIEPKKEIKLRSVLLYGNVQDDYISCDVSRIYISGIDQNSYKSVDDGLFSRSTSLINLLNNKNTSICREFDFNSSPEIDTTTSTCYINVNNTKKKVNYVADYRLLPNGNYKIRLTKANIDTQYKADIHKIFSAFNATDIKYNYRQLGWGNNINHFNKVEIFINQRGFSSSEYMADNGSYFDLSYSLYRGRGNSDDQISLILIPVKIVNPELKFYVHCISFTNQFANYKKNNFEVGEIQFIKQ